MSANSAKIKEIISKAHITNACQALASFNLPLNKKTISLIVSLLKRIEDSESGYERSDILGVILFINKNNLHNLAPNHKIAAKIMETAKRNITSFSLNTHIQFIQFISSQAGLNATDYYHNLTQNVRQEYNDNDYDLLLYKLSSTNYEFRTEELKRIKVIVGRELYNGITMFLRYENLLEEAERIEIVKNIVQ